MSQEQSEGHLLDQELTFTIRRLKELLEEALIAELYEFIKNIGRLLPAEVRVSLQHTVPNFDLFDKKDKRTKLVNLLHLGVMEQKEAAEILLSDAEIIGRKIINRIMFDI